MLPNSQISTIIQLYGFNKEELSSKHLYSTTKNLNIFSFIHVYLYTHEQPSLPSFWVIFLHCLIKPKHEANIITSRLLCVSVCPDVSLPTAYVNVRGQKGRGDPLFVSSHCG